MRAFVRYARLVLGWNLAVILWGAYVRASGSGAGCGAHWPLCNGEVVPRAPALATVIEFTHRAMSGVALVLVAALVVWAWRALPRGHAARRAAAGAGVLILTEALLGAGLVLFGFVGADASGARGWVVALHLVNTFLLLGAIALTDAFALVPTPSLRGRAALGACCLLALTATALAGATGAIAALGDTLFPALSFADGLRQELDPAANVLLRLRVLHPFAALAAAIAVAVFARCASKPRPSPAAGRWAAALLALVGAQLAVGAANVALLAPVALQLVHLLLADLVWLAVVYLGAASLVAPAEAAGAPRRAGVSGPVRAGATRP